MIICPDFVPLIMEADCVGIEQEKAMFMLQQALLGEISAAVRAVTIRVSGDHIHFDAYFDGPISEVDIESMHRVDTELVAGLPDHAEVTHDVHRLDMPAMLPQGDWRVYSRRERRE